MNERLCIFRNYNLNQGILNKVMTDHFIKRSRNKSFHFNIALQHSFEFLELFFRNLAASIASESFFVQRGFNVFLVYFIDWQEHIREGKTQKCSFFWIFENSQPLVQEFIKKGFFGIPRNACFDFPVNAGILLL